MDRHIIKRVYWYIFVSIVYTLYYYTEKLMYFFLGLITCGYSLC